MSNTDNRLELLVKIVADTKGSKANIQKELSQLSEELKGLDKIKLGISKDDVKMLQDIAKLDFSKLKDFLNKPMGDGFSKGVGEEAKKAGEKIKQFAVTSQKQIEDALQIAGIKIDNRTAIMAVKEVENAIKAIDSNASVQLSKTATKSGDVVNGIVARYKKAGKEIETIFEQVKIDGLGDQTFWMPKDIREVDANLKSASQSAEKFYKELANAEKAGKITTEQAHKLAEEMKKIQNSVGFKGISGDNTEKDLKNRELILGKIEATSQKLKEQEAYNKKINETLKEQEALQEKIRKLQNNIVAAQNKNPKVIGANPASHEMLATLQNIDPTSKNAANAVKNVTDSFEKMKAAAVTSGRESMTVLESFKIAMEKFPIWMAASTAFYGTVRTLRSAFQEIVELDSQLTVLKRVSSMSDAEVNGVLRESIELAKQLGNEISDVNESFIAFARQGYRGQDLSMLSEMAVLMSNISDLSSEESSGILTSGLKAFNMEAERSIHIVDSLNEIDNNYSVTTQQLATALQRAAGTASVYGISMERLLGYSGAIMEVSRESGSVVGNALKSIASRITSVEGAITALDQIGISVKNSVGEMRKVDDILDDLGAQWHSLSVEQQQNLGLQIAGRYQLSRFLVLMNQYQTALEMTKTAEESAGSGYRENAEFLKSYQARINQLKNAWVETVVEMQNTGFGDALTTGLSVGLQFMNMLSNLINKVGILPVGLGGASLALLLLSDRAKNVGGAINTGIINSLMKIPSVANTARASTLIVGSSIERIGINSKVASVGLGILRGTLATVLPIAGIMAVSWAIGKIITHSDEAKQKLEDFKAENASMTNSFVDNESKIKNLALQYSSLSNAVTDTSLTEKERETYAKSLVGVQNELANLLPVLKQGEDDYGNAIIIASDAVESRIKLIEMQAQAEKDLKEIQNAQDDKSNIEATQKEINSMIAEQEKYYGKLTALATEYSQSTGKLKIVDEEDIVNAQNKLEVAQKALEQFRNARNDALKDGNTKTADKLDKQIQKFTEYLTQAQSAEAAIASSTYAIIQAQLNLVNNSMKTIDGIDDIGTSIVSSFVTVSGTINASSDSINRFFDELRKEINSNGTLNDFVKTYQKAFSDYVKEKKEMSEGKIDDKELIKFSNHLEEAARNVQKEISKIANQQGLDGENLFGFSDSQLAKLDSNMMALVKTFAEGKLSAKSLKESLDLSDVQTAEIMNLLEESADGMGDSMEDAAVKVYELKDAIDMMSGVSQQQIQDADDLIWMFDEYNNRLSLAKEGTEEYTKAQNEMIQIQEQLATMYPHLINLGDKSIESIMAQIQAVKEEVEAQDILRAAMKASRDGKLTAEEEMTTSNLKNTNARIENINAEIRANQKLVESYASVYEDVKTAAENGDESAAKLLMRISVPVGKAQMLQAELATATAERIKLTDKLKKSEEVMSRTTTSGNKAIADRIKETNKSKKAQDKLNETTKKAIYLTDNYAEALRKVDLALSKLADKKAQYNKWDKEYLEVLKEEMDLLKGKKAIYDSQAQDIQNQISSGSVYQTGIVTVDPSAPALKGNTPQETIWNFFKAKGLSDNAVAGIMGNIQQESSFNPKLTSKAGASGLFQWMGGRKSGLMKYAETLGKSWQDITVQLEYAWKELNSYESKALTALRNTNYTAEKQAAEFDRLFERSAGTERGKRQNYAKQALNTYGGNKVQATKQTTQVSSNTTSAQYYLDSGIFRANQGLQKRTGKSGSYLHTGIDLIAKQGTDIKAVRGGKVKSKGTHSTAGNYIDIIQDDGKVARYLHMVNPSALVVGTEIKAGDSVGKVGSTGRSTTPHLHLEIRDPNQKAQKGDLSPNYGLALDPVAYLRNNNVQLVGGGSSGNQTVGQAEAEFARDMDSMKSQVDQAKQEVLRTQQLIREKQKEIWDAETAGFRKNIDESDKFLQNSDNRLKKMDSSSQEFRDELERQKNTIKNKQKYNQQEIDWWTNLKKQAGLSKEELEYINAKLHELGLEKNEFKFTLDDKIVEQITSYVGFFDDRRDKLARELDFEEGKLETLTKDTEQYYKTLEKINSLTGRNLKVDEEELKMWEDAVKSGDLYGDKLKEAKANVEELRNSIQKFKAIEQANLLNVLSERSEGFVYRESRLDREVAYEEEKLKTLDRGTERYYKTLEKIANITDRRLKIGEDELVVWEEAINSGKLYGETLKYAKAQAEEIRNNIISLQNQKQEDLLRSLNAHSEYRGSGIADFNKDIEYEEALLQRVTEGSEQYFEALKKIAELSKFKVWDKAADLHSWETAIASGELLGESLEYAKNKAKEVRNELADIANQLKADQERFAQAKFEVNDKSIQEFQDKIDFLSYSLNMLGEDDVQLKVSLMLEMQNTHGQMVNSIEDAIGDVLALRSEAISSGNPTKMYDEKIDGYVKARRSQISEMQSIYNNMKSMAENAQSKIADAESKAYSEASEAINRALKESEDRINKFSDAIDNLNKKLVTIQESEFDKRIGISNSLLSETKKKANQIIAEYDRVASTPVYNSEQQRQVEDKLRSLKSELASTNQEVINHVKTIEKEQFGKITYAANNALKEIERLNGKLGKNLDMLEGGVLSGMADRLDLNPQNIKGNTLDLNPLISDPLAERETQIEILDIRSSSYGQQIAEAETHYAEMQAKLEEFHKVMTEEVEKFEKALKAIMEATKKDKEKLKDEEGKNLNDTTKKSSEEEKKILEGHYGDVKDIMEIAMRLFRDEYSDIWDGIVSDVANKIKEIENKVANANTTVTIKTVETVEKVTVEKKADSSNKKDVEKFAYGGTVRDSLSLVGDGMGTNAGSELIQTPDGKIFLSPDTPTLVGLPKGTHITSAKDTRNMFAEIPRYANGTKGYFDRDRFLKSDIRHNSDGSTSYTNIQTGAIIFEKSRIKLTQDLLDAQEVLLESDKKIVSEILEILDMLTTPAYGKQWDALVDALEGYEEKLSDDFVNIINSKYPNQLEEEIEKINWEKEWEKEKPIEQAGVKKDWYKFNEDLAREEALNNHRYKWDAYNFKNVDSVKDKSESLLQWDNLDEALRFLDDAKRLNDKYHNYWNEDDFYEFNKQEELLKSNSMYVKLSNFIISSVSKDMAKESLGFFEYNTGDDYNQLKHDIEIGADGALKYADKKIGEEVIKGDYLKGYDAYQFMEQHKDHQFTVDADGRIFSLGKIPEPPVYEPPKEQTPPSNGAGSDNSNNSNSNYGKDKVFYSEEYKKKREEFIPERDARLSELSELQNKVVDLFNQGLYDEVEQLTKEIVDKQNKLNTDTALHVIEGQKDLNLQRLEVLEESKKELENMLKNEKLTEETQNMYYDELDKIESALASTLNEQKKLIKQEFDYQQAYILNITKEIKRSQEDLKNNLTLFSTLNPQEFSTQASMLEEILSKQNNVTEELLKQKELIEGQMGSYEIGSFEWNLRDEKIKELTDEIIKSQIEATNIIKEAFEQSLKEFEYNSSEMNYDLSQLKNELTLASTLNADDVGLHSLILSKIIKKQNDVTKNLQNQLDVLIEQRDTFEEGSLEWTLRHEKIKELTDELIKSKIEATNLNKQLESNADKIIETIKKAFEKQRDLAIANIDKIMKKLDEEYNAQIKKLGDAENERDYTRSLEKEQKKQADIRRKINILMLDDSSEATAQRLALEKELNDITESIEEMKYKRSVELRKQSLAEEYEEQKKALQKEKDDTLYHFNEILNNERYFAELRKAIVEGNLVEVKDLLGGFLYEFQSVNEDVAKELGQSFQDVLNMIDKINEAFKSLDGINAPDIKDGMYNSDTKEYLSKDDFTHMNSADKTNWLRGNSYFVMDGKVISTKDLLNMTDKELEESMMSYEDFLKIYFEHLHGYKDAKSPVRFDTGGFTGSWGREGKLALLHEKELILNKEDTGNILNAIELNKNLLSLPKLQLPSLNQDNQQFKNIYNLELNVENLGVTEREANDFASTIMDNLKRMGK